MYTSFEIPFESKWTPNRLFDGVFVEPLAILFNILSVAAEVLDPTPPRPERSF